MPRESEPTLEEGRPMDIPRKLSQGESPLSLLTSSRRLEFKKTEIPQPLETCP